MALFDCPITLAERDAARLDHLPRSARNRRADAAINAALDAEGWPRDARGEIPVPLDSNYHYVTVYRYGKVHGHVGPIIGEDKAALAARSWRSTGVTAIVEKAMKGPCLTNNY